MSRRILIIGANSDIAQATIPLFEQKGSKLILASHKPNELASSNHQIVPLDVTKTMEAIQQIETLDFDTVIYIAGTLPDNKKALFSEESTNTIAVNFSSGVRILGHISEKMLKKGSGTIVGISSVGAVRGKSSNVVYGAAKGGFDHFLAGLRQFLHPKGIRVLTVRPGFVATKMTQGMDLTKSLTASPEKVARVIVKNTLGGNRNIVYVKAIWRPISWIIRNIPEPIFKRKQL